MKTVFRARWLLLLSLFWASFARAQMQPVKGFVAVAPNKELYVDYVPPKENLPTVILLNGLTYSTHQWQKFVVPLIEKGIGVLRYDQFGQGQTLLKYAPIVAPISYLDQVEDLRALLSKLKIKGPFNLVGLSYGGGIGAAFTAKYPSLVKNLIMMAPFTAPLEGTDRWIKSQIWATRQMYPNNKVSDDELYDYFLHQIIYATYPQAEPIILENPFKLEATFRLVQGIRKARPAELTHLIPEKALHLMIARQDQYIETKVLNEYWDAVPMSARASRLYINGAEHKMVEAVPNFTASWVYQIVTGNKKLFSGLDFEGYPFSGEVHSGSETIKVGRE